MVDQAPLIRRPSWDFRISTRFRRFNISKDINAWVLMAVGRHLLVRVKSKGLISTLPICLKHWGYIHADPCNHRVVIENDQICVGIWRIVCPRFYSYYSRPWLETCAKYPALDFQRENIEQRERLGERWIDLRRMSSDIRLQVIHRGPPLHSPRLPLLDLDVSIISYGRVGMH